MKFREDKSKELPLQEQLSHSRSFCWQDEPTGALDSKAAKELLRLFTHLNQDGQTILMVTHSVKAASTAGRVLFIKDGKVFHQIYKGSLSEAQMYQKISDAMTAITAGGADDE